MASRSSRPRDVEEGMEADAADEAVRGAALEAKLSWGREREEEDEEDGVSPLQLLPPLATLCKEEPCCCCCGGGGLCCCCCCTGGPVVRTSCQLPEIASKTCTSSKTAAPTPPMTGPAPAPREAGCCRC